MIVVVLIIMAVSMGGFLHAFDGDIRLDSVPQLFHEVNSHHLLVDRLRHSALHPLVGDAADIDKQVG